MDKKTEALKLALEYLRDNQHYIADNERHAYVMEYNAFVEHLEALAEQPAQQEPVAYVRKDQLQKAAQSPMLCEVTPEPRQDRIGIYTSPPASKPWVGLTDEQRHAYDYLGPDVHDAVVKTEAKLKEKNA